MRQIQISGHFSSSLVRVGAGRETVWEWVGDRRCLMVSDENVSRAYDSFFAGRDVFLIPPGEKSKNPAVLLRLIKTMADRRLDRSACLLAVGGGVVSDLAVLASGLYMRGIPVAVVSSSLLGQVDASVGGKCAVNMLGVKNLVGLFRQPELVICDQGMLGTLPEREWRSGTGELIKHALLGGWPDCELLLKQRKALLERRGEAMEDLVAGSIRFKGEIVPAEGGESGPRRFLNLGHSFGHVYEALCGLAHGEAVIFGLVMAMRLSCRLGLMEERDCIRGLGLITAMGFSGPFPVLNKQSIASRLGLDKKKKQKDIALVLLKGLGRPVLYTMSVEEVVRAWPALCLDF